MSRAKSILVAPCHPDLPVYAKGLCKACYMRELRKMPHTASKRLNHKWWSLNVRYMTNDDINNLKLMTVDYFHTMIADHNGICRCCGQTNNLDKTGHPYDLRLNWTLETGIVRGLVCNRCHEILNKRINSLTYPDNPKLIRSMAKGHSDQTDYYNKVANFAESVMEPR